MQSNIRRATRVLVPENESSKNITSLSSLTANETGRSMHLTEAVVGARKVMGRTFVQGENCACVVADQQEVASLTPPSVSNAAGDDKGSPFCLPECEVNMPTDRKEPSLAVLSSQVPSMHANNDMKRENVAFQSK